MFYKTLFIRVLSGEAVALRGQLQCVAHPGTDRRTGVSYVMCDAQP